MIDSQINGWEVHLETNLNWKTEVKQQCWSTMLVFITKVCFWHKRLRGSSKSSKGPMECFQSLPLQVERMVLTAGRATILNLEPGLKSPLKIQKQQQKK